MKIGFANARILLVPKLKRIARRRRLVERAYARDLLDAAMAEDVERILTLRRDEEFEIDTLNKEDAFLRSEALLADAIRFEVPIPALCDADNSPSPDWDNPGFELRPYALSTIGRMKLLDEIRKEKRARHEGRMQWLAWITPFIAGIGVLVTVLNKK